MQIATFNKHWRTMMLVLTRNIGQSITISLDKDTTVVVHVLKQAAASRQLKLGIEAPNNVSILRTELVGKPRTHRAN